MRLLRTGVISLEGSLPLPSERQVLRALRIPRATQLDQVEERGVREAIQLAVRRAMAMATYKAVFRAHRVEGQREDTVVVASAPPGLLRSPTLARRLLGAEEVAFIVVTLGERWDEALDRLAARGEPAEAWFLDALGIHLVDQAARAVEDRVASDMARAALTRMGRYRPGYGDWPLEAQASLCTFLEAERVGVHPNEAMSLTPRKSLTGILGFRRAEAGEAKGAADEEDDEGIRDEQALPLRRREIQGKECA
jgi:hypothetical protein